MVISETVIYTLVAVQAAGCSLSMTPLVGIGMPQAAGLQGGYMEALQGRLANN